MSKEEYKEQILRVLENAAGNLSAADLIWLAQEVRRIMNTTITLGVSNPKNEDTISTA